MDVETVVRLSTTSKGWLRATTSDRIWHKKLRLDLDYPADYRPSDSTSFGHLVRMYLYCCKRLPL